MKPREFDSLIRNKYDEGGFAYDPGNWERLAEQMDGRSKKRSIIMWWAMPLAGMAASVALAMTTIMHEGMPAANAPVAQYTRVAQPHAQADRLAVPIVSANSAYVAPKATQPYTALYACAAKP